MISLKALSANQSVLLQFYDVYSINIIIFYIYVPNNLASLSIIGNKNYKTDCSFDNSYLCINNNYLTMFSSFNKITATLINPNCNKYIKLYVSELLAVHTNNLITLRILQPHRQFIFWKLRNTFSTTSYCEK